MTVDTKEKQLAEQVEKLQVALKSERGKTKELEVDLREHKNKVEECIKTVNRDTTILKELFIGKLVFSIILLVFLTVSKKEVLSECCKWFSDRAINLKIFGLWLTDTLYHYTCFFIESKLNSNRIVVSAVSVVILITTITGLFFLIRKIKIKIESKSRHNRIFHNEKGKFYKARNAVISVDISIVLLIVCICFFKSVKSLLPSLNIFTVWLVAALIGLLIWNGKDLIMRFRNKEN